MKKLAIAAIVVAALAVVTSGAALWRTRDLSKSPETNSTTSSSEPSTTAVPLVDVPDTTNKNAFGAVAALTDLQLHYKIVRTPSATVPERTVMSQTPAPGTQVPPGTLVELTVSSGPPPA
jgi:eukaryotic-like serine/threonine-protein kinase